jgi:hypothetical protein
MFQYPLNAHVTRRTHPFFSRLHFQSMTFNDTNSTTHPAMHKPPSTTLIHHYTKHHEHNLFFSTQFIKWTQHKISSSSSWCTNSWHKQKCSVTTFTHSLLIRSQSLYWGQLLGCHDDIGLFFRDSRPQSTATCPTPRYNMAPNLKSLILSKHSYAGTLSHL